MDEYRLVGYSGRSHRSDILEAMKKTQMKNFKVACITALILLPVLFLLAFIVGKIKGYGMGVGIVATLVVAVILLMIIVATGVNTLRDIGRLNQEPVEGKVAKNIKYTAKDHKGRRRRTKHKIVLETDDGKKIKVKNRKAMPYHQLLEVGDRVRYHPGFIYPIELYDKSKAGKNVCVFCGNTNSAGADTCSSCGELTLRAGS